MTYRPDKPHNHSTFAQVYCRECNKLVCCAERPHPFSECDDREDVGICCHAAVNHPCGHQAGNYVQTD